MRICFKIIICVPVVFFLGLALFKFNLSFSEGQALKMIYGNYNPIDKSSTWVNIPFPNNKDASGYFEKRQGLVNVIFFKFYRENGKDKVFLLTKTIPTNIPFDCHACLPLIGGAVFVKKRSHWEIEAKNQFIMYDGEYGELPVMKLINIGKDKFGLSLEFKHSVVKDRELNILVPYENSIVNAYKDIIYYENFTDCEYASKIQCEAYTADLFFDKSVKEDFYGLQVKKFGTIYDDKKNKMMPVDQMITYQFIDGAYSVVSLVGKNYIPNDK